VSIHIGVDVGGTFTDFTVSTSAGNRLILHKTPSTPAAPEQAITDGIREIFERWHLDPRHVTRLSHGTTVGTNALIQRRIGRVALVTSEGFRDLLEIGRQTRPMVYNIHKDHPKPLVPRHLRYEVPQRRRADGRVHVPLDEAKVRALAAVLVAEAVDCVVVCFLHSYAFPEDEGRAAEILRDNLPASVAVITSSSVYPEFREYERFSTAVVNGALLTVVGSYLDRLTAGVAALGIDTDVKISQSSGGLMSVAMARRLPIRASLSGPAAGVQGAAHRAAISGWPNIITLDAGGTSADVSLLRDAAPVEVNERDLAGFPIRLPALDVNAVGAGGGSIARIDRDGLLKVGPQSAGANPGPACYDLGGRQATVTDANVYVGRLNGEALLDGRMPIRRDLAVAAIGELASDLGISPDETALGIVRVACATMVKAIRSITVERGQKPSDFSLFVYGGAGPLHAIEVARDLGIATIVVPPNPGILCAEGAMNSALTADFVKTILAPLDGAVSRIAAEVASQLSTAVHGWFENEKIPEPGRKLTWSVELRYVGQNYELSLPIEVAVFDAKVCRILARRFHELHDSYYGFASPDEPVQFVNLKVKATGRLETPDLPLVAGSAAGSPIASRDVLFLGDDWQATPVYRRTDLAPGQEIPGPALIEQMDTTSVVYPGDRCTIDRWGNLILRLEPETVS